ncbi:MAG TPA: exo-alpha-sialidase [Saprospiraceae bacterium]|nr:exo-alpha-sialidase [Saprospiraceae bacterium]
MNRRSMVMDNKSGFVVCMMVSFWIIAELSGGKLCAQTRGAEPTPASAIFEIQVGTRKVTTDQTTKLNVPVVPMWNAGMANPDLEDGAGFPVLSSAEHTLVWQPATREDGAYNHYACLIHYKGKFFAMWGNHPMGEDAPGQRILFSHSEEWGEWTNAWELLPPPGPVLPRSEKGIHLKPDRWAIIDDILYAIIFIHGAGGESYPIGLRVFKDGTFDEPFLIKNPGDRNILPHTESEWPPFDDRVERKFDNWYDATHQVSWWAAARDGVNRKANDGSNLIETFMYKAADGTKVLMARNWGTPSNPVHNNRIYVTFDDGKGNGWGSLHPTNIPDSPTRTQAISLDDGRVLLIGSQNVPYFDEALYLARDPLTISVSKDGYTFDRVYAFHTNASRSFRIENVSGRNPGYAYTSSIIHEGWLYTLYSIGKEDMGISRVPLSALDEK